MMLDDLIQRECKLIFCCVLLKDFLFVQGMQTAGSEMETGFIILQAGTATLGKDSVFPHHCQTLNIHPVGVGVRSLIPVPPAS